MKRSSSARQWFSLALLVVLAPVLAADPPIIIAHRGASGYLPEHTLEAYALAIDMGADFIEPDLVLSRDGVFTVRHDHELGTTTNVGDLTAFSNRRRTLDGRSDWYSEDFTAAELTQLRARQPFKGRTREHDDRFPVPTFQAVIDLAVRKSKEKGRPIGIYPELKLPAYFKSIGFDVPRLFLQVLARNPALGREVPVYIQSFDPELLRALHGQTALPLIQLVEPLQRDGQVIASEPAITLEAMSAYAAGAGAFKGLVAGDDGRSTGFIEAAHQRGLKVHVWTLRNDDYPKPRFASPEAELQFYLQLGVDGLFTDFPDTAMKVRTQLVPR